MNHHKTNKLHKKKLDWAEKWFGFLKFVLLLISVLLISNNDPGIFLIVILILLPVVNCLTVLYYSEIAGKFVGEISWTVGIAFFIPPIALAYAVYLKWNVFYAKSLWVMIFLLVIPIGAVNYFFIISFRKIGLSHRKTELFDNSDTSVVEDKVVALIGFSLILFCYAYGVTVTINCAFDNSDPAVHKHEIIKKNIVKDDLGTSYYFVLSPGKTFESEKEITVRKSIYNTKKEGDKLEIELKQGFLGVPWYAIKEKGLGTGNNDVPDSGTK